ncbi:hypothetical protein bcgnr5372_38460 [Bacillus luti]|nr:hypothetical protein [Bacillus cereus]HDR8327228.1 hypothetical protein [Bacillus cereus]HDR8336418.1 hypothetical protein [Bacillus cereus]
MSRFNTLVETLITEGYEVEVTEHEIYKFARITGKDILGGFCSPHDENSMDASNSYINGAVSADHVGCFDKWSKCPLQLPLPTNKVEMDYLINQLKYWSSEDGYANSDGYEFDNWINKYPS